MNNKFGLICSIIQLITGLLATLCFVILAISGENMAKWIVALILSISVIIFGIIGIFNYNSQKK